MPGLFERVGKILTLPVRVADNGVGKVSNLTRCALRKTGNFVENVGRQSNKTAKNVLGVSKNSGKTKRGGATRKNKNKSRKNKNRVNRK